jgi:signal transduction histidine kinase
MSPVPHADLRHRARFEALRTQMFDEMAQAVARWKMWGIVPFNVATLLVLILRGAPTGRALVQSAAVLISIGLLVQQVRSPRRACAAPSGMMIGTVLFLVTVANTGGLASPMLVTGMPIIVGATLTPISPRARRMIIFTMVSGLALFALASRTVIGELAPPLLPTGPLATPEFVFLAGLSVAFVGKTTYSAGRRIAFLYERVALELATRREDACTDTEDRTRALEGIAARLAHEVKNPLAAIKGLSTLMARQATDPKTAERLSIVAAETDRLQSIVDGFLSFSRGLDELNLGPVRPFEIARELSILLETRASELGVTLEVTGNEEFVLNADNRKLRQALLNLVLNAMQASPAGAKVTIGISKSCGWGACITVQDHGPGMSSEVLERIRKPYFTTRKGGSGLGIAVARGLIEQHGGKLEYTSKVGDGTMARIELPVCALKAKAAAHLPNPARDESSPTVDAPAPASAKMPETPAAS